MVLRLRARLPRPLCFYDDHPVGPAASICGRGRSVLQHLDAIDVAGIEPREWAARRGGEGNAVEDKEWFRVADECRCAADAERVAAFVQMNDLHARESALDQLLDARVPALIQIVGGRRL